MTIGMFVSLWVSLGLCFILILIQNAHIDKQEKIINRARCIFDTLEGVYVTDRPDLVPPKPLAKFYWKLEFDKKTGLLK